LYNASEEAYTPPRPLRSGRDKVGEPVIFTVAQNVYGPSHTLLLEKGALARGHVTESAGHGSLGRSGKLAFTCDYARTDDGTRGYCPPGGYYGGHYGGGLAQQYEATVSTDTPLGPAPLADAPSQQLFTLKDKTQAVGVLAGFDGQSDTLTTPTGRRSIKSADVQAIQAISVLP